MIDNRTRLEATLRAVMPVIGDEIERSLRLRILAARELAADELSRWEHRSDAELALYGVVRDVATGIVYARVSAATLMLAADTLRDLLGAATALRTIAGGAPHA